MPTWASLYDTCYTTTNNVCQIAHRISYSSKSKAEKKQHITETVIYSVHAISLDTNLKDDWESGH